MGTRKRTRSRDTFLMRHERHEINAMGINIQNASRLEEMTYV